VTNQTVSVVGGRSLLAYTEYGYRLRTPTFAVLFMVILVHDNE